MKIKLAASFSFAFILLAALSTACGGSFVSSDEGDDSGSTGGSAADGAGGDPDDGVGGSGNAPGAGGGAGGVPTTGGAPGTGGDDSTGTGGEPPQCCLADAVCDDGDLQVDSESDCPIGGECYSNTVCCSTVWCMEEQALCDAIPTCADDETEVEACLEGRSCVKRALCGEIIICQKLEAYCDVGEQPNRHYVGQGSECIGIDLACPEHTTSFDEPCGCGCEQPSSCPAYIDCMPTNEPDPLCNSDECPYSNRLR